MWELDMLVSPEGAWDFRPRGPCPIQPQDLPTPMDRMVTHFTLRDPPTLSPTPVSGVVRTYGHPRWLMNDRLEQEGEGILLWTILRMEKVEVEVEVAAIEDVEEAKPQPQLEVVAATDCLFTEADFEDL